MKEKKEESSVKFVKIEGSKYLKTEVESVKFVKLDGNTNRMKSRFAHQRTPKTNYYSPMENIEQEPVLPPYFGPILKTINYSSKISEENPEGLKNIYENLEIKEIQTFMTQITDDLLEYKILEIVKEFQEKFVSFKEFLNLNIKAFLSLKESGLYNTIIEQYKSEKGSNKLILVKGYRFTNPFKTWVYELDASITEEFSIVQYLSIYFFSYISYGREADIILNLTDHTP